MITIPVQHHGSEGRAPVEEIPAKGPLPEDEIRTIHEYYIRGYRFLSEGTANLSQPKEEPVSSHPTCSTIDGVEAGANQDLHLQTDGNDVVVLDDSYDKEEETLPALYQFRPPRLFMGFFKIKVYFFAFNFAQLLTRTSCTTNRKHHLLILMTMMIKMSSIDVYAYW